MAEGITVKLSTGDVRHLVGVPASSVLLAALSGKASNTVWFHTEEGTAVNGAHIVEIGEANG